MKLRSSQKIIQFPFSLLVKQTKKKQKGASSYRREKEGTREEIARNGASQEWKKVSQILNFSS